MPEKQVENKLFDIIFSIFDKMNSFFENKQKRKTYAIAVLSVIVFGLMLVLNFFAPFAADDFSYHFIITNDGTWGERIDSFSDVIVSMKNHYYAVNGRVVLHGILQLVLIFGKPVFNVLNSLMFVVQALLIYKHCKGRSKQSSPLLFLAINIMLWLFLPSYGMTNLWASGSVNYLWSSVFRLLALLPFRLWADEPDFKIPSAVMAVIMLPLSILAGATNENSAAAFIGMSVLFIIVYKIRKIKLPVWSFTSLIGSLAGFAFIVTAPANFSRADVFTGFKSSVVFRLFSIPIHYAVYLMAPVCVMAALYIIQRKLNPNPQREYTLVALVYFLGSLGGAGVMIASPYFPARAWSSMAVCIIIAAGMMLYNIDFSISRFARNAVSAVAVLCCVWCLGSYIQLGVDSYEIYQRVEKREAYIEEQKAVGNYDVEVPPIASDNPRSGIYSISDIGKNPENWSNANKAAYYGLNSIKSNK